MSFYIGNVFIKENVALAPMAGLSNPTYIKICEEMGIGYAITELISAEAIVRGNKKTLAMLKGIEKINIPIAIQLFGSDATVLAKSASYINSLYPKAIIDINMGCPVPKVAIRSEAGSSLLKNPAKIFEIVSKVVKSVSVPVTVKIRSGWDEEHINAKEVAQICEKAGASAITIHPRTRSQGYAGLSNWFVIKEVCDSVNIPVIGSGDILNVYDAKRMLDETGCDAVMIGRAALGNPWIFKNVINYLSHEILPEEPSFENKIDMMKYHIEQLTLDKCEKVAVLEMRTFLMYYLKKMDDTKDLKQSICKAKSKKELLDLLDEYYILITNKKNL